MPHAHMIIHFTVLMERKTDYHKFEILGEFLKEKKEKRVKSKNQNTVITYISE